MPGIGSVALGFHHQWRPNHLGPDQIAQEAHREVPILDPRGEPLATGGETEQLLVADIEKAPLDAYRQKFPALADMRAEFFGE